MSKFDPVLSVGWKDGDVDMAITMNAATMTDAAADDIRAMLAKAVERFDAFRAEWRPKTEVKFTPADDLYINSVINIAEVIARGRR